jgi:hypothetical protein
MEAVSNEGRILKEMMPPTTLCLGRRVLNLYIFPEMIKWRDKLLCIKCLSMNETAENDKIFKSTDLIYR